MAKKKVSRTRKRTSSGSGKQALGIKYNSLTFMLFLVFVLLVSWLLVYRSM